LLATVSLSVSLIKLENR